MLVAYGCYSADLSHTPEHVGSNVGTTCLIAQIFCEQLFAPVRSREARLDRYLRNGKPPLRILALFDAHEGLLRKEFLYPDEVPPIPEDIGELTLAAAPNSPTRA
jgi:hypothetical protein